MMKRGIERECFRLYNHPFQNSKSRTSWWWIPLCISLSKLWRSCFDDLAHLPQALNEMMLEPCDARWLEKELTLMKRDRKSTTLSLASWNTWVMYFDWNTCTTFSGRSAGFHSLFDGIKHS